ELAPLCGRAVVTRMEDWFFDPAGARRDLKEHFRTTSLKGFGIEELEGAISFCGALLAYARENLRRDLDHLCGLRLHRPGGRLLLDPATRRNLELTRPLSGDEGPTLLGMLDHTSTPMGFRRLVSWLRDIPGTLQEIQPRQRAIGELLREAGTIDDLRRMLATVGDLERLVARLSAGKANARDLRKLGEALGAVPGLRQALAELKDELLGGLREALDPLPEIHSRIEQAIVESPPLSITNGGMIRDGLDPELDSLREILVSGKDWIKGVEARERERTGIGSLKIRFNKVFGYYIEISRSHLAKVPENYQRRQTLVNAERYVTPELKEQEHRVLTAEERVGELELKIFQELVERIRPHFAVLQRNAREIARLDVLNSLARCARKGKYTCPTLVEDGELHLRAARHPVIENVLPAGETFVPNDVVLSSEREQVLLITGPNMAGKSTYLRMVGLVTLLAHMGSWVPAGQATIPLRDQIFTRVGASDNLARGESTFLVEMNEAANILNNATDRSLVLLDEIGRGTSTFDGLSLAWASAVHLARENRAFTLFATHYFELTELPAKARHAVNMHVAAAEAGADIVFLHELQPGPASRSYGIQVAKLAGVPAPVLHHARHALAALEERASEGELQVDLFAAPAALETAGASPVEAALAAIHPDQLSPREALDALYQLKAVMGKTPPA
ncbi:MAG: DNA mismatch repair protein MutS, partial [Candidatus Cloacimonetes bacterium]|nr:DNA mismatch repair protein MutS [Candidatus Cloacimonadota bacterium]